MACTPAEENRNVSPDLGGRGRIRRRRPAGRLLQSELLVQTFIPYGALSNVLHFNLYHSPRFRFCFGPTCSLLYALVAMICRGSNFLGQILFFSVQVHRFRFLLFASKLCALCFCIAAPLFLNHFTIFLSHFMRTVRRATPRASCFCIPRCSNGSFRV